MDLSIQRTKAFYERYAETYLIHRDPYYLDDQVQIFSDHFLRHHADNGELLDVGCANALRYPSLKRFLPHARYTGVDFSQAFIRMAEATYPCLDFYESDISDWDTLPQKKFSGAWCSSVLQHVPERLFPLALSNVYMLLKPRGIAYISLPTDHMQGYHNDSRHFTILSPAQQREHMHAAGFKILDSGSIKGFKSDDNWQAYIVQRA